jgi:hypothetical protein
MKTFSLACLISLVVVTSLSEPAQAGRRARRRTAIAVGVVAATASRSVVVVAPVVVPVAAKSKYTSLTPDLTITEMTTEGDSQCVTVKNIGQTTSPKAWLQIDFNRVSDGVLVATKKVRVVALRVNQSIRFRLHALPQGRVEAFAEVDPENLIAELNEQNNDFRVELAPQEPAQLEDVEVWVTPNATEGAGEQGQGA